MWTLTSCLLSFSEPDKEDKLTDDYELQAWGLELVADGNPGCGIKVNCKENVLPFFIFPDTSLDYQT